jgi:hypothetical protein
MRTTIRLDDELLNDAKRHAIATGRTLTAVIEDALRQALARSTSGRPERRVALPVARGGGRLQPGVDLDDSATLLDLMETTDASR